MQVKKLKQIFNEMDLYFPIILLYSNHRHSKKYMQQMDIKILSFDWQECLYRF